MLQTLFAFGYASPDVPVYVYYQPDYPVRIEGIESSSLAVKNGKEMLLLICDWKNGGTAKIQIRGIPGFEKIDSAKDVESGESLAVSDNTVDLPIKKYDFRVIKITGK